MTPEDLKKYKAFKSIIGQGEFKIKGEAILAVASLFQWFHSLESEPQLEKKESKGMKPVGPPVKIT